MLGPTRLRARRALLAASCLFAAGLLAGAPPAAAARAQLGGGVYATALLSAGGVVWYAGSSYTGGFDVAGRIGSAGELTEQRLPPGSTPTREITGIAAGPLGDLWLSTNENRVLHVAPDGTITQVPVPAGENQGIVSGPDGALRIVSRQGLLVRLRRAGEATVVRLPAGSEPHGLAIGSDGAVWVVERGAGAIARVAGDGSVTQYPLRHADSRPAAIVAGPDHSLWFSEEGAPRIGRITPGGVITEFVVRGSEGTRLISNGPEGNLWYTQGNRIGSITTSGAVGESACVDRACRTTIDALAAGPSGELLVATGVRETAAGEGISLAELPLGGAIIEFEPKPLRAAIVGAPRLRGRRLAVVRLTCHGGVAGDTCRGRVVLRSGGRFAGGGGYRLAPMTGEALPVVLTRRAARTIARRGRLRLRVAVSAVGGAGDRRTVVLRARRR